MNSPTSIVNTLLESDHADYDPSLDPFSDPKVLMTTDSAWTTTLSVEDICSGLGDGEHTPLTETFTVARFMWRAGLLSDKPFNPNDLRSVTLGLSRADFKRVTRVTYLYVQRSDEHDPDSIALSAVRFSRRVWKRLVHDLCVEADSTRMYVKVSLPADFNSKPKRK